MQAIRTAARPPEPSDFDLGKQSSVMIMTDCEPDDAMMIVGTLRYLAKAYGSNTPPLAIVSGGANAAIQNARSKKYVSFCKEDGIFPKHSEVEFIRGENSEQEYRHQGRDVLTERELADIGASRKEPETDRMISFLEKNPQTLVFCLKRPDEILKHERVFDSIKGVSLVAYTGSFNVKVSNKELLKKLYDSVKRVAFVQNYTMLQNNGDGSPNNVTKVNTPNFAGGLERAASANGKAVKAVKENIRLWNEKIIYDFAEDVIDSDSSSLEEPEARSKHDEGVSILRSIMPENNESFVLDPEMCSKISALSGFLNEAAILNRSKEPLGFHVRVLLETAREPLTQAVIADQLALFATTTFDKIKNSKQGIAKVNGRFVDVEPVEQGNALLYGPIKGRSGKGVTGPGTRIDVMDRFLCKSVLGQEVE